jgi:threonine dehydratase
MEKYLIISKDDILSCYQRIKCKIHNTPVHTSSFINSLIDGELFFKCENFQKVGAFKFRGATNAISNLNDEQKKKGVATHSSGNHAQALALAAKMEGIKAYIVMPSNSKKVKINAVKDYGAEVILCKPTLQSREDTLQEVVDRTGAHFVHPYDNYDIICGQSTAAFELLKQCQGLNQIIAPVGGGGLLSGTALATHYFSPESKIYAAEPSGADDAYRSFNEGKIIPSVNPNTIADGLLTSLGEKNFPIIKKLISEIFTVNDDEIIAALKMIWERMKIIVEPSSAVPLAAILKHKHLFKDKKTGIIISGGNVDLENLPF